MKALNYMIEKNLYGYRCDFTVRGSSHNDRLTGGKNRQKETHE